ncbi:MAG: hypothetical protein PWQ37_1552 [Candidatus Petromonas sp.]|jgi:hypothetical protein|nr:hypothetical protein [Candidatus Petromonas sp.]
MSKEIIKMKMDELHGELEKLIQKKNFDLLDSSVIIYSKRLDKLIVEFMKRSK